MPKVVVYVRIDDAHIIEADEQCEIGDWVRTVVREQIMRLHARRVIGGGQVIQLPLQQRKGDFDDAV